MQERQQRRRRQPSPGRSRGRRVGLLGLLGLLILSLLLVVRTACASSSASDVKARGVKGASGSKKKAGAGGAALGRKRRARAAGGKEDPDVIPFLASTKGRFKKGADLTSSSELTGFLGRAAKGLGRAFVGSSVFRFMAEEKIFETVAGMLAYRVAFSWSKDPSSARKARLLFTVYICLYLGALLYCRQQALALDDARTLKVAAMPAMLGSLVDMAKKMKQQGAGGALGGLNAAFSGVQEKEMTFRDYDLQQVKTAMDRFAMFLLGMTFLHFKMKNIYMIMYWGILGPVMMVREPLFQVHIFGMDETGIRERPFGPKEEPESVEEPAEGEEGEKSEEAASESEAAVTESEESEGAEEDEATVEVSDDEEEEEEEAEEESAEEEADDEEEEELDEEDEEELDEEDEEGEFEDAEEAEGLLDDDDEAHVDEEAVSSDHAANEQPATFHVSEQEEDVHPHAKKGAPAPEAHFRVLPQEGDSSE